MRRAFTLIELLIVISIIGLLTAIVIPNIVYRRYSQRLMIMTGRSKDECVKALRVCNMDIDKAREMLNGWTRLNINSSDNSSVLRRTKVIICPKCQNTMEIQY